MKIFKTVPWLQRRYSAFSADTIFSEENVKKTITNFAKMKPLVQQSKLPVKKAAVLIPLCVINDKVSLLYTLRAANLKSHRGQVSFPGGMEDAGDKSVVETALRETQEELGIGPELVEVWGKGNIVTNHVASVMPVVGVLKISNLQKDLSVNPGEVKEVFTVPLEVLCDPQHVRHTQFRANYSLPVYTGGKRKIWGLTAIITHLFLRAMLSREEYNPSVKFVPPLKASSRNYGFL
ncbi:hypothetical protein Zmor_023024 [Zophobas morio]|uniref:Nudix hydrolase domain-containing protein n=1 Tax=Zophobas morio TaxID=2755281 RepID=A0AA38HW83_9CUCU|nr:hypothetical protein Zmor_023024 [Zophobas morio]